MGLKIKRSTKEVLGPIQASVHGDHRQIQSRKSVIRMLSMIIMIFNLFNRNHGQFIFFSNNLIVAIIEKLSSTE